MERRVKILFEQHYIYLDNFTKNEDKNNCSYLNAFLLINYGIEITNSEYVNDEVIKIIDSVYSLNVPEGFYESPQDTKYFSTEELLLEQVVSYYLGYGTSLKRVELFKKVIPQKCVVGDEIKLRTYTVIGKEEGDKILIEVAKNLASYKRPFSSDESMDFLFLVEKGYLPKDAPILCRDNIFPLLNKYIEYARYLDKKDVVKYSISILGETPSSLDERFEKIKDTDKGKILIQMVDLVKDCPLSKRQAKYFNKVFKLVKGKKGKEDNSSSPYRTFISLMKKGEVVKAAIYLKEHGSLLERNMKYILSRTTSVYEVREILSLLDNKNPTLLLQTYMTLMDDEKGKPRLFRFLHDKYLTTHIENEEETKNRQSVIDSVTKQQIKTFIFRAINEYYLSLPRLGKIYVSDEFKNIAIPINTANTGKGLDVLPSGSRIPFNGRYIRTFCHWEDIRDIDASLVILNEERLSKPIEYLNNTDYLSWRTYHTFPFGTLSLCSGDDTSYNGVEYQDIDIDGLYEKGYRYAFCCINGYGGNFNRGTIIQGLQIKKKIDTKPWDPKNIEFQMNIVGDCSSFTGFAIDLEKKEMVVINSLSNCGTLVDSEQVNVALRQMSPYFLEYNMYTLLTKLGEVVDDPLEADVVFSRDYQSDNDKQKIVRPYDVAALVSYVNMKKVD